MTCLSAYDGTGRYPWVDDAGRFVATTAVFLA